MRLWENKCDLMGKRMDFNAYGKLNVILWEEFSYGKINVILWEKKCPRLYERRLFYCIFIITILVSINWLTKVVFPIGEYFKIPYEICSLIALVLKNTSIALMLPVLYIFR